MGPPAGGNAAPALISPFQVVTKPTGAVCNLACAYCFYLDKRRRVPAEAPHRMSEQVLDAYVRQYIRSQPGPDVTFVWQGGEPTLLGVDFFRRVVDLQGRYASSGRHCHNALQTNGTLLDDHWGEFLAAEGFLVGISLDGSAPLHDCHRVDRRGRPTHTDVMRGLRVLQRHGVAYNVLCVVHHDNADHPLDVYRFFCNEGVEWLQFIPLVERMAGGEVSERTVAGEAYGEFLVAIFDEWVRRDVGTVSVQTFDEAFRAWLGMPALLCVHAETCGRGLAIEHDGTVFSCDHFVDDDHRLGNIADSLLGALVDLPAQRAFGEAKRDLAPECSTCDVRFACNGGCPKDRFAPHTGTDARTNHLCAGYRRFFRHADPFLRRMTALWRRGSDPAGVMAELAAAAGRRRRVTGRNDPCPCGSGAKFKHCCLATSGDPPAAGA